MSLRIIFRISRQELSEVRILKSTPLIFLLKLNFERFLNVRGFSFQIVVPILKNEFS